MRCPSWSQRFEWNVDSLSGSFESKVWSRTWSRFELELSSEAPTQQLSPFYREGSRWGEHCQAKPDWMNFFFYPTFGFGFLKTTECKLPFWGFVVNFKKCLFFISWWNLPQASSLVGLCWNCNPMLCVLCGWAGSAICQQQQQQAISIVWGIGNCFALTARSKIQNPNNKLILSEGGNQRWSQLNIKQHYKCNVQTLNQH